MRICKIKSWCRFLPLFLALSVTAAQAAPARPSGKALLWKAASEGSMDVLRRLPKNTDWNVKDENGENALIKAVGKSHTDVVKFLIAKKADLNLTDAAGNTALFYAVSNNDRATVQALLKAGARVDVVTLEKKENLLFEAARVGASTVADLILHKKKSLLDQPNTDGVTPIFEAIANAQYGMAVHFLKMGASVTPHTPTGQDLLTYALENGAKEDSALIKEIRQREKK